MTRPSPAGTCYPMSSSGHGAEHPFLTSLQPVHVHQLRSGKRNRSQERPCITHMGLCQAASPGGRGGEQKSLVFPFSGNLTLRADTSSAFSSPFAFRFVADVLFPCASALPLHGHGVTLGGLRASHPLQNASGTCKGSMQDWDALKRNSDGSYISTARTDGATCQGVGCCPVQAAAVTLPAGSGVTGRRVAVHVHASCCALLTAGSRCKSSSRSRRCSLSNLEGGWFSEIGIKISVGGWEGKRGVISPRMRGGRAGKGVQQQRSLLLPAASLAKSQPSPESSLPAL